MEPWRIGGYQVTVITYYTYIPSTLNDEPNLKSSSHDSFILIAEYLKAKGIKDQTQLR